MENALSNLLKGDKNVIKLLNAQLTNELTAINQYFLHARMYRHWGLAKLGHKEYEESIGEMKHADKLINRILMLDGLPNVQALHKVMVGENTPEMLQCDLNLEYGARHRSRKALPALKLPPIMCRAMCCWKFSTIPKNISTGWKRS